ncbi:DEAD/DEAH box helicase [Spirochaetota bacterium]
MSSHSFADFGFSAKLLEALAQKGFEEPTPIQTLAIPKLLSETGHLVARARTGTGKTAAFGLPLVERLSVPAKSIRALILVPTRELAIQVSAELASFVTGTAPRIAAVYGGASMGEQLRRLSRGLDIVVGTPGRILDHIERKSLDLSALEWLVLDEADEMLDMGFLEDIERVMDACNPERRVVLFSATMPQPIIRIIKDRLKSFDIVEDETKPVEAGLTDQIWLEVRASDKLEALCRIVDSEDEFYGLVFCHTKIETDAVARALAERGYAVEALHGDVSQDIRERTLKRFKDKKTLILVATDVAARGIDIDRLSHVVNFNLPFDPESYTHRIGRTGRAGNKGTAITFVTPDEYRRLFALRKSSGEGMHKGSVPTVDDVIEAKQTRIKAKAIEAARDLLKLPVAGHFGSSTEASEKVPAEEAGDSADSFADEVSSSAAPARDAKPEASVSAFYALADGLLKLMEPRAALAALAAAAYASDLDPRRYGQVHEINLDDGNMARLYLGIGRVDGVWPKDVAALVKKLTGLPDRLVDDIEVLERFSFVSVPRDAAERAVQASQKQRGPNIRIAAPKTGAKAGSGRRSFRSGQKRSSSSAGLYPKQNKARSFSGKSMEDRGKAKTKGKTKTNASKTRRKAV